MTYITLKTTRTKFGEATAKIQKFYNYSQNKVQYCFQFYSDRKFFNSMKETMDYINSKYEIVR